ncbi:hypothetical protein FH972_002255 [Carpinus fangiana]|uniref:Uncharacterized protein n=1 Tax=Carpinus fangiana TaxID=176857 RepID=A0A5N6QG63_9ROSI|nr:hypothetical protein FH972_002255 [Carpinus fangiana]
MGIGFGIIRWSLLAAVVPGFSVSTISYFFWVVLCVLYVTLAVWFSVYAIHSIYLENIDIGKVNGMEWGTAGVPRGAANYEH